MDVIVVPGDGIGLEVTAAALAVLRAVAQRRGIALTVAEDLVGGASIDAHGSALRPETIARCKRADAVLFGAVEAIARAITATR